MQIIPFKRQAQFIEQIQLGGSVFYLIFKWNTLNEYWSMNILDGDENPLIFGVKVVTNFNLLEQYSMSEKPEGNIVCQNVVGGWEKIRRYDMGQVDELIYYALGKLEAINAI